MFFFILDGGFKEVFAVLFSFVFVDGLGGFLFYSSSPSSIQ